MQKKHLLWLLLFIVLVILVLSGRHWLNLDTIRANRDLLASFTDRHYLLMLLGCGVVYSLSTAVSLPGGTVLSLLLGFLFGRWVGTLLIVISATLGAVTVFWLARYLLADWAEQRLRDHPLAKKLLDGFQADAFNYLLFLRLVPAFPFWLVNLAPAFTQVSLQIFVITTFVGIIPGSFVFANLGQSLANIQSLDQLLSIQTLVAFSLLGILSLSPVLLKRYRASQVAGKSE